MTLALAEGLIPTAFDRIVGGPQNLAAKAVWIKRGSVIDLAADRSIHSSYVVCVN
jgi:hypothetical protein